MDRQTFTILFLFFIVALLLLGRVYFTVDLVTSNYELAKINSKIRLIRIQNTLIREQVLKESSLHKIQEKAEKGGFIDATYYTLNP